MTVQGVFFCDYLKTILTGGANKMVWLILIIFLVVVIAYVGYSKKQNETYMSAFLSLIRKLVEFGVFKVSCVLFLIAAVFGIVQLPEISGGFVFIWLITTVTGIVGIVLKHTGALDKMYQGGANGNGFGRTSLHQSAASSNMYGSSSSRLIPLPIPGSTEEAIEIFCNITSQLNNQLNAYNTYDKGFCSMQGLRNENGSWNLSFKFNKCNMFAQAFETLGYSVNTIQKGDSIPDYYQGWILAEDPGYNTDDVLSLLLNVNSAAHFGQPQAVNGNPADIEALKNQIVGIVSRSASYIDTMDCKANFDPGINQYWFIVTLTYPGV